MVKPGRVCVLGSANLDIVARVKALARPGETVMARDIQRFCGGKGLNQAIAAARLGAAVRFIGAVGNDEAASLLRACLDENGVDLAALVIRTDMSSGQALIAVSASGENTIIVSSGANASLTPEEATRTVGDSADAVFLAQLETPLAAVEAFFASPAAQRGIRILNAAPAGLAARRLFGGLTILVLNEIELAQFSGVIKPFAHAHDMVAASRSLLVGDLQTVVVTLGGSGVLAVTRDAILSLPAVETEIVDTTGAGDCFCGALATVLAEGMALRDALDFANRAAAVSVSRQGASSSMPHRHEIRNQ